MFAAPPVPAYNFPHGNVADSGGNGRLLPHLHRHRMAALFSPEEPSSLSPLTQNKNTGQCHQGLAG
jgi:hypothetical protein